MHSPNLPTWFTHCVQRADELLDSIGIVIVANVKGRTVPIDDYTTSSIITEFLSATELDDIVKYFETAGIYLEVLLDEQGFVEWLSNGVCKFPRRHALIYNLAQNGIGPGRLTTVAGLCRIYRLPLIDSNAYVTALTQHKFHVLSLLNYFGLPIASTWGFTNNGWVNGPPPDGVVVIAKPSFESASIGITADSVFEMNKYSEKKLREYVDEYKQVLTVQEFIEGFEIEVPVFESGGPQTITTVGIELEGKRNLEDGFLSYENVFSDKYGFYNFAEENNAASEKAMDISRVVFEKLGINGIGRVDFRVTPKGEPRIMEVNCKPHITKHSGFSFALKTIGKTGKDLAKFMVGSTAIRYRLSD